MKQYATVLEYAFKNGIKNEYGSTLLVRFLTPSTENSDEKCLDCEAHEALMELRKMNVTEDSIFDCVEILKNNLIWVLENVNWPVGEFGKWEKKDEKSNN